MKFLRVCIIFAFVCIAASWAAIIEPNQAEPLELGAAVENSAVDVEKKTEKRGIYGFGYGHGGYGGGYGHGHFGGHGFYGGHGYYGHGPYYGGYAVHHAPYYGHHGFYPYHGGYFH